LWTDGIFGPEAICLYLIDVSRNELDKRDTNPE